ncbi:MAG: hypothetical protein SGCHY_003394 [Lobulomycetales sp.]
MSLSVSQQQSWCSRRISKLLEAEETAAPKLHEDLEMGDFWNFISFSESVLDLTLLPTKVTMEPYKPGADDSFHQKDLRVPGKSDMFATATAAALGIQGRRVESGAQHQRQLELDTSGCQLHSDATAGSAAPVYDFLSQPPPESPSQPEPAIEPPKRRRSLRERWRRKSGSSAPTAGPSLVVPDESATSISLPTQATTIKTNTNATIKTNTNATMKTITNATMKSNTNAKMNLRLDTTQSSSSSGSSALSSPQSAPPCHEAKGKMGGGGRRRRSSAASIAAKIGGFLKLSGNSSHQEAVPPIPAAPHRTGEPGEEDAFRHRLEKMQDFEERLRDKQGPTLRMTAAPTDAPIYA